MQNGKSFNNVKLSITNTLCLTSCLQILETAYDCLIQEILDTSFQQFHKI